MSGIRGHDPIVTKRPKDVYVSAGSDNVLRDAIGNIEADWCSVNNPWVFHLGAGTYEEIQITPLDGVEIVGAGIDVTIINTDGLREDIDPVSGAAYSAMDQSTKHGIYGCYWLRISDLTWTANDVKYCVHADGRADAEYTLECRGVSFKHSNGETVGIGCFGGQSQQFTSCQFEKLGDNEDSGTAGAYGMFWHNGNAQSLSATLVVSGCGFENCGVLVVQELDSGQTDSVTVTNCTTDDTGTAKGIYIQAASDSLAYCIEIVQNGSTMPDFAFDAVNRPSAADHYTLVP